MQSIQISQEKSKRIKQSGQTMVEFILLLCLMIGFSLTFLKLANGSMGKFWQLLVQIIAETTVTLR